MKIKWHYHYINECREVVPGETIDIFTDKLNRWQLRGHILSRVLEFPIVVATIQMEDSLFTSRIPTLDHHLGFSMKAYRSTSIESLMITIQTELEKIHSILNGA